MNSNLLLKFILCHRKRVESVALYHISGEFIDSPDFFEKVLEKYPPNLYPLPVSILSKDFPDLSSVFDTLPIELSKQEEIWCLREFQKILSKNVILRKLSVKEKSWEVLEELARENMKIFQEKSNSFDPFMDSEFNLANFSEFKEQDSTVLKNILPAPFPSLSRQLGGGFIPGGIYAFESTTKSKKSMLILYFCSWYIFNNFKVCYISLELSPLYVRERLIRMFQAFIDPQKIVSYTELSQEQIQKTMEKIPGRFLFKSFPPYTLFDEIAGYLKDKEYDVVFIDPPKYILPSEYSKGMKEWESQKLLFDNMFSFSKRNNKVLIAPTYVNREGDKSIKRHQDTDIHYTAGSFDTNTILEAKYALIPRSDLDNRILGEEGLSLKPLFIRRSGEAGGDPVILLTFNTHNFLFREKEVLQSRQIETPETRNR